MPDEKKTSSKAYPTCPHCGHEHGAYGNEPTPRWYWDEMHWCVKCGKPFKTYPVTLWSTFAVKED